MEFHKRLLLILINKNITNIELSRETGISTARISNYCNGKDMPSIDNAIKLVNQLLCSFDYLLGLTDINNYIDYERKFEFNIFHKRLTLLLNLQRISQSKLCREIHINKSCFSQWKKGLKPKTRTLIKIAQYLDCSIDFLLGY